MGDENYFEKFIEVPLKPALSKQTIDFLSESLNSEKIIGEGGYNRDWRGFAVLLNFSKNQFNLVEQSTDKFRKLLDIWIESYEDANFDKLLKFICLIDRHDVHDDIIDFLTSDAKSYFTSNLQSVTHKYTIDCPKLVADPENHIITKQDLEKGFPQFYDVFILYSDDEDLYMEKISEIVFKVEQWNFSLCIQARDFLFGITMDHEAVLSMIAHRCRRVLIFVTKSLLINRYNKFLTQFCQKQSIVEGRRKIIPILMEEVELPLSLKSSIGFKHYKQNRFVNFYESLKASLKS